MDEPSQPKHPLDIPSFLIRDPVTNRAEFMTDQVEEQELGGPRVSPKSKAKANGVAKPVKAEIKKPAKVKEAKPEKKAKPKVEKKAAKAVELDQYGLRKGSARSQAVVMYARKSGASLEEVKAKTGSIQLNVLNQLEKTGKYVVTKEKQTRKEGRPLMRYWLKPVE